MKLGCGRKHLQQSCKRGSYCQTENISEFDTMNYGELFGNHADFVVIIIIFKLTCSVAVSTLL